MSHYVDQQLIGNAFEHDAALKERVLATLKDSPGLAGLFEDIAKYHVAYRRTPGSSDIVLNGHEPPSKKRKVETGVIAINVDSRNVHYDPVFQVSDLSFSVPIRKKLQLELAVNKKSPKSAYIIRARNAASNEIEYQAEASSFCHVCRLPVPEKAQKQYNFCLIARTGDSLVWTVNHGPLKSFCIGDEKLRAAISDSDDVLEGALNFALRNSSLSVIYPSEAEFASSTPEAHRKNEKAYHVKAFRGSKDGYLFFLENGILFGFKRPLQFFPFDDIESISYTSILQRTFNLNITHKPDANLEAEEVEFSMLDQADFAGIDAYVKRHELQDASLAETRKAKNMPANGIKKGNHGVADDAQDSTEPTDLQKAQAEIEDEEDELEEEYDPGSEGESEGSGDDSDGDDEHPGGEEDADLVEEELGSEAEEVEPDPDDDDQL